MCLIVLCFLSGILFQDITTLLLDTKAFRDTIDLFVERYRDKDISVVAGNYCLSHYFLVLHSDCCDSKIAKLCFYVMIIISGLIAPSVYICNFLRHFSHTRVSIPLKIRFERCVYLYT